MYGIVCVFRVLSNISELFWENNIFIMFLFVFIIVASVYRPPTPLSSQQHHQTSQQQPYVMMAATGAPHANHNLQNIQIATNNQMMHGNWLVWRISVALRHDLVVDLMTWWLDLCYLNLLISVIKRWLEFYVVSCIDIKRIRYIIKLSEILHACPHNNF